MEKRTIFVFKGIVFDNEKRILIDNRKEEILDEANGKWEIPGGKIEFGETPESAIKREIFEETGLVAKKLQLHGFVSFPELYYGEDEMMFIYTCHDFDGEIHDCDEGVLQWVDNDKIHSLPMWEGDYHFFEWIKDDKIHSAKIVYENDHVIEYQENCY